MAGVGHRDLSPQPPPLTDGGCGAAGRAAARRKREPPPQVSPERGWGARGGVEGGGADQPRLFPPAPLPSAGVTFPARVSPLAPQRPPQPAAGAPAGGGGRGGGREDGPLKMAFRHTELHQLTENTSATSSTVLSVTSF